MRTAAAMLLLAALTVAAPADSLARAEKDLAYGLDVLAKAPSVSGKKRIAKLQQVKAKLRSARRIAKATLPRAKQKDVRSALQHANDRATLALVSILNEETGYYLKKRKLTTARKRNAEALKLMPKDRDAVDYKVLLKPAKKSSTTRRAKSRNLGSDTVENRRSNLPGLEHRARIDNRVPTRRPAVGGR